MPTRQLGQTDLNVSPIGFGASGLGSARWKGIDARDAQRALYVAMESGLSFVDTALHYGDGHSESLVGEVVRDLRARDWAVVATKVPPRLEDWSAARTSALGSVYTPEHITHAVERSLRNTGLEVIPLEQLHLWYDHWLEDPAWPRLRAVMEELVRQGKVLHWGVSAASDAPEASIEILSDPLIESVQVTYNIVDRRAEESLFEKAAGTKTAVIARMPLDVGGLTGMIDDSTRFPPGDGRNSYFTGDARHAAVERTRRLSTLLGDEAPTLPELALRFCLSRPEVTIALPGMRTIDHVRENLRCLDGRGLSPDLLARLD